MRCGALSSSISSSPFSSLLRGFQLERAETPQEARNVVDEDEKKSMPRPAQRPVHLLHTAILLLTFSFSICFSLSILPFVFFSVRFLSLFLPRIVCPPFRRFEERK